MRRFLLCALSTCVGVLQIQAAPQSVWPKGLAEEMNTQVGFRTTFDLKAGDAPRLEMCAWYSYRVTLNGAFVGHGPARGPKGLFRPDDWDLSAAAKAGSNELLVEVAGYNVPNFYLMEQPPFFKATVRAGGRVLAETKVAGGGFTAERLPRLQKVVRYSYQRTFSEWYSLPGSDRAALELAAAPEPKLLPRRAPYPAFELSPLRPLSRAQVREDASIVPEVRRQLSLPGTKDNGGFKGFRLEEIEHNASFLSQRLVHTNRTVVAAGETAFDLTAGESVLFDRGLEDTGFPGMTVEVLEPGQLVLSFDEVLTDGEVKGTVRTGDANALVWDFTRVGSYEIAAFEPYALRYLDAAVLSGRLRLMRPSFRSYKNPTAAKASFRASDPDLAKVFSAAVESFRQNAVDVFTDCPGRERAGWNCDAYFTAASSALLTGTPDLETLFFENFAAAPAFDALPEGMLPMCYPSDHPNGQFIPNWALWFTRQAGAYLRRGGDAAMIGTLRPRLVKLIDYLWTFRNSDGLLEKLPSWVFVEWSPSNWYVQDVNYPSNMTWAEALETAAELCGRPDWTEEARRVRETVRRQSWTGEWFADHAVRQADGSLKVMDECTETCQYYAFYHRIATPESHPDLWNRLLTAFGPKRFDPVDRTKLLAYPQIAPSNAFVGNYLRLMLLARANRGQQILDETKGYFTYMADRTGTLWENDTANASCCHGFASYAAVLLVESVLGAHVDAARKRVTLRETDAKLDFCEVTLPVPDGEVRVTRTRSVDGRAVLDTSVPKGWRVCRPDYDVSDFGAVGDGKAKDTQPLQRAIDAAAAAGGGRVVVSNGWFVSGTLTLRSNVELHVDRSARIIASSDRDDYNAADFCPQNWASTGDNMRGGHLIVAVGQTNVTISGRGIIDGNSPAFLKMPDGSHPPTKMDIPWRPGQMLFLTESKDVVVRDVRLVNSPYWTFLLYGCEDVEVSNVVVRTMRHPHTYNGDGIDIDACRNVRIRDCDIDTSDDSVTLRAAGSRLVAKDNVCENITVERCLLSSDCNAVRVGVGSGEIRHAVFRDCQIHDSRIGVCFVAGYLASERGASAEDVAFDGLKVKSRQFLVAYHRFTKGATFRNVSFARVSGESEWPSRLYANGRYPFENFSFRDVSISSGFEALNVKGLVVSGGDFPQASVSSERAAALNARFDKNEYPIYEPVPDL